MPVWLKKTLLPLVPLLVQPVPLFADQEQPERQPLSPPAETLPAPKADNPHRQDDPPPAPKSFQPSDKISADSALAFPVDI